MTISPDVSTRDLNDCGCCEGTTVETPATISNRPGLSAIAYRAGTHAQFKDSMLARLSSKEFAALQKLNTREDDDFTIALLDGWATVADVLTFYQERIANESYLRTATERQSLLQLARLIGYALRPGVAAGTYLAFTLEDAPGAPKRATIDVGTKVQSIPGPGEQPQTFETIEAIDARAEWNALKPQTSVLLIPKFGDTRMFLKGVSTNLKAGDALLFVGSERENDPKSDQWDFRRVLTVSTDNAAQLTLVTWEKPLGSTNPLVQPSAFPTVYALRKRAAAFASGAADWHAMVDSFKASYLGLSDASQLTANDRKEWPDFTIFAPTSSTSTTTDLTSTRALTHREVAAALTAAAHDAATHAAHRAAGSMARTAVNATRATAAMADLAGNISNDVKAVAAAAVKSASDAVESAKASVDQIVDDLKAAVANPDVFDAAKTVARNALQKSKDSVDALSGTAADAARAAATHATAFGENTRRFAESALTAAHDTAAAAGATEAAAGITVAVNAAAEVPDASPQSVKDAARLSANGAPNAARLTVMLAYPEADPLLVGAAEAAATGATETRDAVLHVIDTLAEAIVTAATARRKFPPPTADTIDLDQVYQEIVKGTWVVLWLPSYVELYDVVSASEASRAEYALSSKVSRVQLRGENLSNFDKPRSLIAFGQSEQLALAETPLTSAITGATSAALKLDAGVLTPVEGNRITLALFVPGLDTGHRLIVSGKASRVDIVGAIKASEVTPDDSSQLFTVKQGDVPLLVESPTTLANGRIKVHLQDKDGNTGWLTTGAANLLLAPATKDDAAEAETVSIESIDATGTRLTLSTALKRSYDRTTVVIYANVAAATAGETKQEVLGSGDGAQPYQQFILKQSPLTYVGSTSPSGADSTLQVRVNDVVWHELPALYEHGPRERIYVTRRDDDGKTTVEFGDGQTGARLPTGRENVKATYRKGIGAGGNVKAGQLSLLMTHPLGVKGVINPEPAGGGAGAEQLKDARTNAPITVLTLDRIVSLRDYEDFARAYAGVAKARATWTWDGQTRGVFVTVAGPDGAAIPSDSILYGNLLGAMGKASEPYVSLRVQSYTKVTFKLEANFKVDPDYEQTKVLAAAELALRDAFSFEARQFGQPLFLSEIMQIIQGVQGVIAVDVLKLYRKGDAAKLNAHLAAAAPRVGADGTIAPAELLTLDPAPLALGTTA